MKPLLLTLCCAWAAAATAQPAQTGPTLGEAVQAAWERSTHKSAASGRVLAARAGRAAADAPWAAAPALELGRRGDPLSSVSGQRETEIGVAWPLLLPGQRAARASSAEAGLGLAQAGERSAMLLVAGEVREAAWRVQARVAELAAASAHAASLRTLAEDVDRRVSAGDLARSDALAARAEFLAAEAAVAQAEQGLRVARAEWRVLTGSDVPPQSIEDGIAAMPAGHPLLQQAQARTQAAREALGLVRATRRDPPELTVRYRHEVAAAGLGGQDSVGFALRVPLGTEDRNLPREAAAHAELDVAAAEERRLGMQLEAAFAQARAAAQGAERQLALAESRARLLRERSDLVERSFRAGETALPEMLRTLAAAALADSSLARQRSELGLARARARQAAGVLP